MTGAAAAFRRIADRLPVSCALLACAASVALVPPLPVEPSPTQSPTAVSAAAERSLASVRVSKIGGPSPWQADWTLPVPPGTAILEPEPAPDAQRGERRIELVLDLVIAERGDDLNYVFGSRPPSVDVDGDGNIYVAEPIPRTGRVLVFDAAGEFVRQIGRAGQGPGEYLQPFSVEWVDDRLFVFDPGQARLTVWNAAGDLLDGRSVDALRRFRSVRGLADGSLVGTRRINLPSGEFDSGFLAITRVDDEIEPLVEYVQAPWPQRIIDPGFGEIPRTEPNAFYAGATATGVAVAADGSVYVSTLDRYQIVAYAPDGTVRWALRVPRSPQSLAEIEVDWLMDYHSIRFPQRGRAAIEWPETQYALGDIQVDGQGRLYVFPYVPRGSSLDARPVDVYSPDGELLFSGVMTGELAKLSWQAPPANGPMLSRAWQAAQGDFVYGVAMDPETSEWQVVRHRLRWPR